jgi:alpha-methylacyl-CoA racemase
MAQFAHTDHIFFLSYQQVTNNQIDVLRAGKRTISLNLKQPKAIEIMKKLCNNADVIIEPYRPGVMEKLGLGPNVLLKENPRLIYARLTGFGSDGKGLYSERAGHDINYLAISGLLSMFGRKGEKPIAPVNLAADFAGGGLMCAFGICIALLERHRSGKGQVVDCAMVEGAAYVGSWLYRSRSLPVWGGNRGENFLDTGNHSYDTYETKDGRFMAVGALEPQFYAELLKGLDLDPELIHQLDDNEKNKKIFTEVFKKKTRDEWAHIFDKIDACTFPVLDYDEAPNHQHNKARQTFLESSKSDGCIVPNPAPKLSRTPAVSSAQYPEREPLEMALEILKEIGMKKDEIKELYEENILILDDKAKL